MNNKKSLYGQSAKRSLGQNFLQDKNIAHNIVRELNINSNDFVIEIGPGPGALTSFIKGFEPQKLCLIEKDSYWAKHHSNSYNTETLYLDDFEEEFKVPSSDFLQVFEADALKVPWEIFIKPCKIIGNLPYNIASPLMWEIVSRAKGLEKAVFMVQREVAQRIEAVPSTKAYGALSVWIQSFFEANIKINVPPHVFHPQPRVHSAVLSFEPVSEKRNFDKFSLSKLLKMCFQARRKQLGTILKSIDDANDIMLSLGINPKQRPETLTPLEFQALGDALFFQKS